MDRAQFEELVKELYTKKEYRPVGVAILYRGERSNLEFLFQRPTNAPTLWTLPQGGIDSGETMEANLSRELKEELSIDYSLDIESVLYGFMYRPLTFDSPGRNIRGFTKGKAYFFSLGRYIGRGDFTLDPSEVLEVGWKREEEADTYLKSLATKKSDLSRSALLEAISLIRK